MSASFSEAESKLTSAPKVARIRFASILDWARSSIDDAMDRAGLDNLVNQANDLYDRYVKPVDVPWVPDVMEPTLIDQPAKLILEQLIRGFHDLVHIKKP